MIDDEKIIELFFERSEQGIRELNMKYGKICHNLSYNIVNSRRDAEECVNDAYLGAYANHIGVRLDKEQAPEYSSVYGIDLPDGQSAGDYSLGDRVEVMYTGEPATILTIWAEQLVDIKLLK